MTCNYFESIAQHEIWVTDALRLLYHTYCYSTCVFPKNEKCLLILDVLECSFSFNLKNPYHYFLCGKIRADFPFSFFTPISNHVTRICEINQDVPGLPKGFITPARSFHLRNGCYHFSVNVVCFVDCRYCDLHPHWMDNLTLCLKILQHSRQVCSTTKLEVIILFYAKKTRNFSCLGFDAFYLKYCYSCT